MSQPLQVKKKFPWIKAIHVKEDVSKNYCVVFVQKK